MSFYAVAHGRRTGVFSTWDACRASVAGFKNAVFKKFESHEDASNFVGSNGVAEPSTLPSTDDADATDYYVYTDGACTCNGREGAKSGIGVFFGEDDPRNVSLRIGGKQTNNTAELSAVLEAYRLIKDDVATGKRVVIVSDSEYVLRCVTTFGARCAREGWVKKMPNRALVRAAYEAFVDTGVRFMHVRAHTGRTDEHSIGNAHADRLAVASLSADEYQSTARTPPTLFKCANDFGDTTPPCPQKSPRKHAANTRTPGVCTQNVRRNLMDVYGDIIMRPTPPKNQ